MANDSSPTLRVEVAYARPDEQVIIPVEAPEGATVEQVIVLSRIQDDRVEIYRPLLADPKAVRKQRAAEGKRMRKGGGDLEPGEG
ncbi:MAG: hypothetical protein H6R23_1207 [Proteobacteria bacterium]|nr:hypothetical protein [Pseudomonadota bacterium]